MNILDSIMAAYDVVFVNGFIFLILAFGFLLLKNLKIETEKIYNNHLGTIDRCCNFKTY